MNSPWHTDSSWTRHHAASSAGGIWRRTPIVRPLPVGSMLLHLLALPTASGFVADAYATALLHASDKTGYRKPLQVDSRHCARHSTHAGRRMIAAEYRSTPPSLSSQADRPHPSPIHRMARHHLTHTTSQAQSPSPAYHSPARLPTGAVLPGSLAFLGRPNPLRSTSPADALFPAIVGVTGSNWDWGWDWGPCCGHGCRHN